jgi:hypothetical protein
MLITRQFLLLHVPRTGGESLRSACLAELPMTSLIANDLEAATPYEELVEDFGDLPMLSIVRNPWEWYADWYSHMTEVDADTRSGPIWESAFERGKSDFETTVRRACTGVGFDSPRTSPTMQELDCDHFTALHRRAVGTGTEDGRVELLRFENLAEGFTSWARRHRVEAAEAIGAHLKGEEGGGLARRPYRLLYDESLRKLVARRASLIVEGHGYGF